MEKSRVAAAFMALFVGGFGVHKFYLRDPGAGIFYIILMFMTARLFPVSMLLGVLDAIRLFSKSDEQFDNKYNKKGSSRSPRTRTRTRTRGKEAPSQRTREIKLERERYHYSQSGKKLRDNPFKRSGDKKYKEYDLEDALVDYDNALEINPDDEEIHFNLAAIYSLMENKDKSFFHLEKAVSLGFKDSQAIQTIDELAFLRIQPEFELFQANGYKREIKPALEAPKEEDLLQDDVLLSQLNKLKDLRSRGLLSQKEFNYEKEKLFRK